MDFLARRGFWSVFIRYRGTWESGGSFLSRPPHRDALDVIAALPRGFSDVWEGVRRELRPSATYVIGASFGGTAAVMASLDPSVTKAVALAPVIDWTKEGKGGTESPEFLFRVIREGYGGAYRFSRANFDRLLAGGFFDPWTERDRVDPSKLLIIHAKDDTVTSHDVSARFGRYTGCAFVSRKRGGHLSLSQAIAPQNWPRIERFLAA